MANVVMYSTGYCPYCTRARALLDDKNLAFHDIRVDEKPELRIEMQERSGRNTVPQIFINDQHIGGCDDLFALEEANKLNELLT